MKLRRRKKITQVALWKGSRYRIAAKYSKKRFHEMLRSALITEQFDWREYFGFH